jgi:hypothetical protein
MSSRYRLVTVVFMLLVVPTMAFSADRKSVNADSSKPTPSAAIVQKTSVASVEKPKSAQASYTAVNPKSGEQIKWQVISSGGNRSSSTNYVLSGTVGQTATARGHRQATKLIRGSGRISGRAAVVLRPRQATWTRVAAWIFQTYQPWLIFSSTACRSPEPVFKSRTWINRAA